MTESTPLPNETNRDREQIASNPLVYYSRWRNLLQYLNTPGVKAIELEREKCEFGIQEILRQRPANCRIEIAALAEDGISGEPTIIDTAEVMYRNWIEHNYPVTLESSDNLNESLVQLLVDYALGIEDTNPFDMSRGEIGMNTIREGRPLTFSFIDTTTGNIYPTISLHDIPGNRIFPVGDGKDSSVNLNAGEIINFVVKVEDIDKEGHRIERSYKVTVSSEVIGAERVVGVDLALAGLLYEGLGIIVPEEGVVLDEPNVVGPNIVVAEDDPF